MLVCPVCHHDLHKQEHRYTCKNHHMYDIAKEGYVNLYLKSAKTSGDELAMVQARRLFLSKGYYTILQQKLIDIIKDFHPNMIVDAGCGEGYYTNAIAQALPDTTIYGVDLSKRALKYAAKRTKHVKYVLSSIFHMPIKAHQADILLNVFAPFAYEEYTRMIHDKGYIICVEPGANHLMQLKQVLYETPYQNEETMHEQLSIVDRIYVKDQITCPNQDLQALFMMTPYYHKTSKEASLRLESIEVLDIDIEFVITIYQK